MADPLHLVLGGYGSVGNEVLHELKRRGIPARAVERSKDVPGFETLRADALIPDRLREVCRGASHLHLCLGVRYTYKDWAAQWPIIMKNVIDVCEKEHIRLIFLDNIYMYGPAPLTVPFDEGHRQEPPSKKGKIRKLIANMVLEAHNNGRVKAVIGRAADFYGPRVEHGLLYPAFLENMLKGKGPQSLARLGVPHTYAFIGDMGRALVDLALAEHCYGQVWHLPVGRPVTVEECAAIFNAELKTNLKVSYISRPLRFLISLFIPAVGEVEEMLYQSDTEYRMSWEKFKKQFPDFKVTDFDEGMREMVRVFKAAQ